jgi:hypothetical protein
MNDILNAFEKHGQAASFLLSSGRPAAAISADKRIRAALDLYHLHPQLHDKMHDIARGFVGWRLVAHIESQAFLDQSDRQRAR